MLSEIFVFLGVVFVVVVAVLWRSRAGGSGELPPTPSARGDRPEAAISNESTIGPHRNVGRPWRADPGDRRADGSGGLG